MRVSERGSAPWTLATVWPWVVALAISGVPGDASGHAPPLGYKLLTDGAGQIAVVVANRGLIFRDAADERSRLMCNDALRINTAEVPAVVLLEDGSVLAGTSSGLRKSADHGCTWIGVGPFGELSTPAVASDRTRSTIYIATYGAGQGGIHVTRDGGESWAPLHTLSDSDYVTSLMVAAPDSKRVYATGTRSGSAGLPSHFLLRTRDGGTSWDRIELSLLETDYLATLLAGDPNDADRLLVATTAFNPRLDRSRLLVSPDGGDTFETRLEALEITSAGFDAQGRTAWVAARDGLYRSDHALSSFGSVSQASVLGCALEGDGALWVCGHYAGEAEGRSGVGISLDRGDSFSAWLDFASVSEPVACDPGTETHVSCQAAWRDWELEMLGERDATPAGSDPSVPVNGWASAPGGVQPRPANVAGAAGTAARSGGSGPGPAERASCAIRGGAHRECWAIDWALLAFVLVARRQRLSQ